ncbi:MULTISPECIES: hypothetical protein [Agrobacterium]|uniref:hypothetical protein n=1 Tax=Agrobacterium tumefaciens TaxID=358 RepID=UPI002FD9244D
MNALTFQLSGFFLDLIKQQPRNTLFVKQAEGSKDRNLHLWGLPAIGDKYKADAAYHSRPVGYSEPIAPFLISVGFSLPFLKRNRREEMLDNGISASDVGKGEQTDLVVSWHF